MSEDVAVTEILNKLFAGETVYLKFSDPEEADRVRNLIAVRKSREMKILKAVDMVGDDRIVMRFKLLNKTKGIYSVSFDTIPPPSFTILTEDDLKDES